MEIIANGAVFYQCIRQFGVDSFWWQQDNGLSHRPGSDIIKARFKMRDWPPHGPGLLPQCVLNNLVSSSFAPCGVYIELGPGCLNGHWRRVHEIRHANDAVNVPEEITEIIT
jgi:hypothetical protein